MSHIQQFAIPISIVIAGAMIAGAVILTTSPASAPTTAQLQPAPTAPLAIAYDLTDFASLGDLDAPVTMVEYSDYACPFCKRFVEETKPQIVQEYIDKGLVRFVRKDFIAVGGQKAAEAAHCAGDQGAYWEYQTILMANQTSDRSRWNDPEVHRGYAAQLGINPDALISCFSAGTHTARVNESTQEGARNGGSGTPYFIINDVPVSGAQPYAVFKQIIDAELAK